jgi:prepilin-type N-terminal cleavage/methylation domain-containing protein
MKFRKDNTESGFSLIELLIAMAITITLMTAATSLLASALRIRSRENQKSDALADTQRALNIMSREIASAGFNLTTNGIVAAESGSDRIRIRANLNKYDFSVGVTDDQRKNVHFDDQDRDEDISYFISESTNTKYLARHDAADGIRSTVLANRIDAMNIHYFGQKVSYTAAGNATDISAPSATEVAPTAAKYIVIAVAVRLDAVGTPGTEGYQPGYTVLLCSDVALRNADLWSY